MSHHRLLSVLMAALVPLSACADADRASGGCPPAQDGGPAPPSRLSETQMKTLRAILARYRPDQLDAPQVLAIREAICKAGIADGPAVHAGLAQLGFSAKRMAEIAPPRAAPAASAPAVVTPSGRRVPRPE